MPTRMTLTLCAALLLSGFAVALGQEPLPAPEPAPFPVAPEASEESIASLFTNGPGTSPAPAPLHRWERRFWATGDYLFAWQGAVNLPPLVTTSPAGTPRASAGVLGAPGTSVLFEGPAGTHVRSGLRFGAGYWLDGQQALGLEAGFMILEGQARGYSNSVSDGILARPFIDSATGTHQAILIAFPGASNGSIDIRARTGNFYEAHLDLSEKSLDFGALKLYSLIGYRFYSYNEGLDITQSITTTTAPNFVPGTRITTSDRFSTRNDFNGLDLGLRPEFYWRNFSLELLTKFAFGGLWRTVAINGDQTVTVPNAGTAVQTGGAFALSSNIGTRRVHDWTVLPELGATLYWQVNSRCSLRAGYTALWLQDIAHASDQIDFTLNKNLFPGSVNSGGASRPTFINGNGNIWIHAVNLGLEYRY